MDYKELHTGVDENIHWYYQSKQLPLFAYVEKMLTVYPHWEVMDIGAGSGYFSKALLNRLPEAICSATLIDTAYTEKEVGKDAVLSLYRQHTLTPLKEHQLVLMMDVLNATQMRYTTKAYDASKKIPDHQFQRLLEILRLTPSSVNIQPWHFLIADNIEAKTRIAKGLTGRYAYNAPKVLDASHSIIFCTRTDVTKEHLEQLLKQDDLNGRFKDEKAKEAQGQTRAGYVEYYRNEQQNLYGWMENQTFIALGQLY